jgi:hypothetical protein
LLGVAQLTPAAGDRMAVEPRDAGQASDAARTMLAGEEAGQQPLGTFIRRRQKSVEGTMLTGHAAVGMVPAGGAGTNVDESPLPLGLGEMFLLVHGSLPPFGRSSKEAKVLYLSIGEVIVGR